jgi:hypothetical protein
MAGGIVYKVAFRPGRYKFIKNPINDALWMIGREDDGSYIGFAFSENDASHICLALNLVDSYICGDTVAQMEMLMQLQKLRH